VPTQAATELPRSSASATTQAILEFQAEPAPAEATSYPCQMQRMAAPVAPAVQEVQSRSHMQESPMAVVLQAVRCQEVLAPDH
jgi:hypothetical protein